MEMCLRIKHVIPEDVIHKLIDIAYDKGFFVKNTREFVKLVYSYQLELCDVRIRTCSDLEGVIHCIFDPLILKELLRDGIVTSKSDAGVV